MRNDWKGTAESTFVLALYGFATDNDHLTKPSRLTQLVKIYNKLVKGSQFKMTTINQPNTQTASKVQNLSLPNIFLRIEGLAVLIAAIVIYAHQRGSIWLFLLLILAPDLGLIGYLRSARLGSISYDVLHLYALPIVVAGASLAFNIPTLLLVALIWFAHIGMDRVVGYGLRYPTAFKDSHMQHV